MFDVKYSNPQSKTKYSLRIWTQLDIRINTHRSISKRNSSCMKTAPEMLEPASTCAH